jgi:hypothetical protein
MALLVLRRVGLCVGQNQMCHLCGWLKLNEKKVRWEKIKNTEGSARSVGLLDVRFQYGLYVFGHSSKWFTFSVKLSACRWLLCRPLRLHLTCIYARQIFVYTPKFGWLCEGLFRFITYQK